MVKVLVGVGLRVGEEFAVGAGFELEPLTLGKVARGWDVVCLGEAVSITPSDGVF